MKETPTPTVDLKKRDSAIDCLKAFAIFLVLWGHCLQNMSSTHYADHIMYRVIYSFHMPLFMAMVGYFASALLNIRSFIKVFWKKFRQLLVPAIVFITILSIADIYPTKGFVHGFKHVVINLWFLKSAFICTIMFYICARNPRFRKAGIVISLIISQFIHLWYFQINIMYPCFIFGYVLHHYRLSIEKYSNLIILFSGFLFLGMLVFYNSSFWDMPSLTISPSDPSFLEYWFKTVYKIIIGISGTSFFFTLFITLIDKIIPTKIKPHLVSIGSMTLGIYLVQALIVEIIFARHINFKDNNPILYNMVITPSMAILSLFMCVAVVKVIQNFRFTSRLLLGK